jgi:hypothetical protein
LWVGWILISGNYFLKCVGFSYEIFSFLLVTLISWLLTNATKVARDMVARVYYLVGQWWFNVSSIILCKHELVRDDWT